MYTDPNEFNQDLDLTARTLEPEVVLYLRKLIKADNEGPGKKGTRVGALALLALDEYDTQGKPRQ